MSLGSPDHVNSSQTASALSEQWVYGGTSIYLDDGLVASFQQSQ